MSPMGALDRLVWVVVACVTVIIVGASASAQTLDLPPLCSKSLSVFNATASPWQVQWLRSHGNGQALIKYWDNGKAKSFEFTVPRAASLLPSPFSAVVAIADNYASDSARTLLINLSTGQTTHLTRDNMAQHGLEGRDLRSYDHLYVRPLHWLSADRLVVTITGYDAGSGRTISLVCLYSLSRRKVLGVLSA